MTEVNKIKIIMMKNKGMRPVDIERETGIPAETVRTFCKQKLHDFCENPLCDDFDRIYDSLNSDVTKAQENYKHTAEEYSSARYRFHQTNRFYSKLRKQTALVTEFDEFLWYALVDCIKIYSKEKIVVVFKDGTEI